MSLTIQGIIVALLSQFLPAEEVSELVTNLIGVIGILMIWYGRYRIKDIKWWGGRK